MGCDGRRCLHFSRSAAPTSITTTSPAGVVDVTAIGPEKASAFNSSQLGFAAKGGYRHSSAGLPYRPFGVPIIFRLTNEVPSWYIQLRKEAALKVELTPDAAQWVQAEVAAGRFRTAEDAVRHAVNQTKLIELRGELAAAEAEGGTFTTDDVRRYARDHLDRLKQNLAP
jgi:Arc/MetJ-type ribon-helix-helix transcriptional regulator